MEKPFEKNEPCKSCPYRKDAALAHWDVNEFIRLTETDHTYLGNTYDCHQQDGNICRGWLMDQDRRGLPSIKLRMLLSKHQVPVEYLESLHCSVELFNSVEEMCRANFPETFTDEFYRDLPEDEMITQLETFQKLLKERPDVLEEMKRQAINHGEQ